MTMKQGTSSVSLSKSLIWRHVTCHLLNTKSLTRWQRLRRVARLPTFINGLPNQRLPRNDTLGVSKGLTIGNLMKSSIENLIYRSTSANLRYRIWGGPVLSASLKYYLYAISVLFLARGSDLTASFDAKTTVMFTLRRASALRAIDTRLRNTNYSMF
ncbi:uncharacterized protein BDZ99DRAFT_264111 [Mytilinidion resinicola]|uniref:Uncharacterized protein n=1 Tax=Mytilinidion resinicola TaxID=574789 RepID=A0A6A6YV74_9PEZI|nr:uncharacterized protein BDZ99DRAFT_264111 [Mytilinidion resinicola]KAF2812283.1 hypothetical protein BDZ99DRAFT_264111 [Mytilinidion resinicola]